MAHVVMEASEDAHTDRKATVSAQTTRVPDIPCAHLVVTTTDHTQMYNWVFLFSLKMRMYTQD